MRRQILAIAVAVALSASVSAQQDGLSQQSITGPPPKRKSKAATAPKAIETPDPAPARHIGNGVTLVWAVIGIDGRAHDAKVAQSSGSKEADDNALAAIQKWRFEPSTVDGHPVAVQINIKMITR